MEELKFLLLQYYEQLLLLEDYESKKLKADKNLDTKNWLSIHEKVTDVWKVLNHFK